jgi:hypothetical protein
LVDRWGRKKEERKGQVRRGPAAVWQAVSREKKAKDKDNDRNEPRNNEMRERVDSGFC